MDSWQTRESLNDNSGESSSSSQSKLNLQSDLNLFYGDMESLERTIAMWRGALNSKPTNIVLCRRLLAQASQRRLRQIGYEQANPQDIDEIINLMESNIIDEPGNGTNIRLWFEAIRYCKTESPDYMLDKAIDKLDSWRQETGKLEAYYYYFVCTCIKAIEGSTRHQSAIPRILDDLKAKAQKRYDNLKIHEWLGKGHGLQRLVRFSGMPIPTEDESKLDTLPGRISKYKNPGSAYIQSYGMDVFFNPKNVKIPISSDSEGKRISVKIGFCYEGVRAYDQSISDELSGLLEEEDVHPIRRGLKVKCRVTKTLDYFTKVKLVDYPNQYGSIHINELGESYSAKDRPRIDEELFAMVINNDKIQDLWQLSLIDPDKKNKENATAWRTENGKLIRGL